MRSRLAIVATHPIQYFAPWFAYITKALKLDLKVFYLWDYGIVARHDRGFHREVKWDIPLLEGYNFEFLENRSPFPGTGRFAGLWNPDLAARVGAFHPDAVLLTAYNFASIWYFLTQWRRQSTPLLFRGDSHRLVAHSGTGARLKQAVITRLFRRFSAILYVGSANRDYFKMHGVSDESLFYSPHAIDIDRFLAAREVADSDARLWRGTLGIPAHHKVILFAGKLEEKKRPLDLLKAFEDANLPDVSLLFVGSGPQESRLRDAATRVGSVHFAPFQNQSLMPRTYAIADVFVLPSYGPGETWGLAVNEAMCLARPVIASEHVGCAQDLVIPYETGLRFPAGDIAALKSALRTAFEDPTRLKRWGENGSVRIRSFTYGEATSGLRRALLAVGVPV